MFSPIHWIFNSFENIFYLQDEEDPWKTFSVAFYLLIPVTGLIILWGRKDLRSRLLLQLDRSCISVFCPSLSKREKLLKWASARLPENWSSHLKTLSGGIVEFWTDGSLLCTLINTAVPGACPNPHRHWKKPPSHGQKIAYKYLSVVPIFTDKDLTGKFSMIQERRFIHYLYEIYQAINNLQSSKEITELKFSCQYVARGMGLYAGEQYRKTTFYIYPHKKTRIINNICISIRGPYSTFGKRTFMYPTMPHIQVTKLQNKKTNPEKNRKSLIPSFSLDLTSFLGKDSVKVVDDIPMDIQMESQRIRVSYIPKNYGMYEINLMSDGEMIPGSPYNIHIVNNTTKKIDNFDETIEPKKRNVKKVLQRRITVNYLDDNSAITNNVTPLDKWPNIPKVLIKNEEKIKYPTSQKTVTKLEENQSKVPKISVSLDGGNVENNNKIKDTDSVIKFLNRERNEELNNGKNFLNQIENNNKLKYASLNEDKCIKSFVNVSEIQNIAINDNLPEAPQLINNTAEITENKSQEKQNNITNTTPDNPPISSSPFNLEISTSPICPNHIAPEVDKRRLSLAEKRKSLKKQKSIEKINDDQYSSFSDSDNEDILKCSDYTENTQNSTEISSAKSLPNIPSSVPERKDMFSKNKAFWESVSNLSSSSIPCATSPVKTTSLVFPHSKVSKIALHKSSDNISSNDFVPYQEIKSYKSIDNSLDYCTIFTIEERKKFLLKSDYEKEKIKNNRNLIRDKNRINNRGGDVYVNTINNKEEEKNFFNSQSPANEVKSSDSMEIRQNNFIHNDLETQSDTGRIKSHFKKSIQYFKNLEKSITKAKFQSSNDCDEEDIPGSKAKRKSGGSLNFSKQFSKFSDIFSKSDVDSIATYSRTESFNSDVTFKPKKIRKSLKSIFDVYY